MDGTAVIESPAEGQDGDFYTRTQRAVGLSEPHKDVHSEGADSFRQARQGYRAPAMRDDDDRGRGWARNWKTA